MRGWKEGGVSVRGTAAVTAAAAGACSVDGDVARLAALNEARRTN